MQLVILSQVGRVASKCEPACVASNRDYAGGTVFLVPNLPCCRGTRHKGALCWPYRELLNIGIITEQGEIRIAGEHARGDDARRFMREDMPMSHGGELR